MSYNPREIQDDEIRIIGMEPENDGTEGPDKPDKPDDDVKKRRRSRKVFWWIVSLVLFVAALVVFFCWEVMRDTEELPIDKLYDRSIDVPLALDEEPHLTFTGYTEIVDTVVGGERLTLLIPRDAVPQLVVGPQAVADTTAVLLVQAADVRGDNGGIVGAYVLDGELLSRGQSKAGFCAIIDNNVILGVADSTPYLEQAIESGGDFFRQYPLVVGGLAVENRLALSSLRKALAQLDGQTVVVLGHRSQTLNEFAQTLTKLGVTNAIYLVGSTAYGFARDRAGFLLEFGEKVSDPAPNTNYIVWQ